MSSAGAVRAGAAFVEIFANDSKFQQALTRVQNRLKATAASLRSAGASMAIGGAALGAPFLVAAREAAGFTLQMAQVRANTGATEEQFQRLTTAAREMGVAMGRSPTETANAMSELAKAGLDAEGTIAAIGPVLALAAADGMELSRAVEVVVGTMSQFGMATSDFGSIADRLQAAANASTTSVDLIGESLSYVGPQAQMAGQSFDEVAAALGALAQGGIRGSMAGTQLARVLESMADSEDKFNKLGVSVRDANGNLRPFMDVLRDLGAATAGMNNTDRIQAFMDIFDIRGARAAATLSQLGGEFDRILNEVQGSAGAAAGKASQVLQSFGGQVQVLAAKFADLKIAVITSMGQTATSAVTAMGRILEVATQFVQKNPQLVATVAAVAGGLLALGVAATLGGITLGVMAKGIGLLKAGLSIIPALCTPIGIAIMGIAAAVTAATVVARELSPSFRREFDSIWQAVMALDFSTAWELMNINFALALVEMGAFAENTLRQIGGFFAATGSFIGDKLIEGIDRFMGLFGADILTLQAGFEKLSLYFRAAFDWKWAVTGLRGALAEVDKRVEAERAKAGTADDRANSRAQRRQENADARQAAMDNADDGWAGTAAELRAERERIRDKLKPKEEVKSEAKPGATPPAADRGVMPIGTSAVEAATRDFGASMGGFGTGEGMGIGSNLTPLEDAGKRTADNTARTADAVEKIALAVGVDGADTAVGGAAPMATLPARAAAAQSGAAAAASGATFGDALSTAITQVVEAVNAHAKISESHTGILKTIAENTARGGLAFS